MERGRDLEQVLNQYMNFVKPAFEEFCLPVSSLSNFFLLSSHLLADARNFSLVPLTRGIMTIPLIYDPVYIAHVRSKDNTRH